MTDAAADLSDRRARAAPFVVVGMLCIIAGGLIAGVMSRRASEVESWAVAFLVLVSGVAQIGLGVGQAFLVTRPPTGRVVSLQLVSYNVGCALVLIGTLTHQLMLTDVGGVVLAIALALLLWGVRPVGARVGWRVQAYRMLIVIVLVSIPIGLVLARIRAN